MADHSGSAASGSLAFAQIALFTRPIESIHRPKRVPSALLACLCVAALWTSAVSAQDPGAAAPPVVEPADETQDPQDAALAEEAVLAEDLEGTDDAASDDAASDDMNVSPDTPIAGEEATVESPAGVDASGGVDTQPGAAQVGDGSEAGLPLLDSAMDEKMAATRMGDLDRVVTLCEQALEKGLSDANQKFAKDLIVASLYEKAHRLMEAALDGNIDNSWGTRRALAERALQAAVEKDGQHGESYLLLAELEQLPGGDAESGKEAAAKAVELMAATPVRQAEAYLVQSDYTTVPEERLQYLDKAVELDPANVDTWKERGFERIDQGLLDLAAEDLRYVLEQSPDDMDAIEALARVLASQDNFEEALALSEKLILASPKSPTPLILRGGIYLLQGKTEEALKDADSALAIEPKNLNLLFLRARILAIAHREDEALKTIDAILAIRPDVQPALQLRMGIYVEQGRFGDAIEDVMSMLGADPQNVELMRQLAALYLADDRPRRAIEEYSRLVDLPDVSWEVYRGRADAYLAIGEHANAVTDYSKALELEPNDDGVLNNLAWVLATSPKDAVRDGKRAIDLAQRACERTDFKAAHILSTLAASYAETGDFKQAQEWSAKAVELSDEATREQLKAELKSYEEQKPWREITEKKDKEAPDAKENALDFDLSADIGSADPQGPAAPDDATPATEETKLEKPEEVAQPRVPSDP